MYTVNESNYRVIKLPCNVNSKAKNVSKRKTIQFIVIKHNYCNGMNALVDYYRDHPFVDRNKATQNEGHSQHFSKRSGFWT